MARSFHLPIVSGLASSSLPRPCCPPAGLRRSVEDGVDGASPVLVVQLRHESAHVVGGALDAVDRLLVVSPEDAERG
jgi:hypothetical protein